MERIFNLYLAGETVDNISKMMQAENYAIPGKTISFSKGMIMNMLSNERYCGEAPMYYVQNNHPAIIDRVTFNKVQEELARRKTKTPGSAKSSITSTGKYSRYALTDVLICGNCGTRYRRVTWSRNGTKRIVWRCISRLDYGKKYCSLSPIIMEDKLQEAIVRAVNKFNEQDNATYKALMRATISEALGLNGDPEEVDMLERSGSCSIWQFPIKRIPSSKRCTKGGIFCLRGLEDGMLGEGRGGAKRKLCHKPMKIHFSS